MNTASELQVNSWTISSAQKHLGTLIEKATVTPQIITVKGEKPVVILPLADYQKLVKSIPLLLHTDLRTFLNDIKHDALHFEQFKLIFDSYIFSAQQFQENDGSITLSLNEIDIVENAPTEQDARLILAQSILHYAEDYINEFDYWYSAPNRKKHFPYILKTLVLNDVHLIGNNIICQHGEI
ncbi:hypothetical protein FACS1894172_01200 [Spirochaetia bacterium]|nr:hypothetical protein FACS1894164_06880 [Spirochaetia bacterium]GHU29643.1 hypothetical protein FACS1894172_01200 [Spirochaetia bacterium]